MKLQNTSEEKRRHSRFSNVEGIQGDILIPADVQILNIDNKGAVIETTRWLDSNREYSVKATYKDAVFELKCQVIWSILTKQEKNNTGEQIPVYSSAVQFIDIMNGKKEGLANFVHTVKQKKSGTGSVGYHPMVLKLCDLYRYVVKNISLSGMLVKTAQPFAGNSHYAITLPIRRNLLNIMGRIVHYRNVTSDHSTEYDMGIEFVEVLDSNPGSLEKYIGILKKA